jgi:pimeloyl-ACP methyl ester carboxylesterase
MDELMCGRSDYGRRVENMQCSSRRETRANEIENGQAQARRPSLAAHAVIGLATLALFPSSAAQATAPVSAAENMVCSADTARPDRNMELHEQFAQTENGSVGYYRFGQGSPLILITGYRAALSEWNTYFLAELAKRHEVIVFDNRGIGRSAADIANYHAQDLARDTSALIKTLGFNSVAVLGWSMGGTIAQRLALDDAKLVNHLILLSTEPPGRASIPLSSRVEEILSGRGGNFDSVMHVLFPDSVVRRAEDCFSGDMFKPRGYQPVKVSPAVTAAQQRLLQDWQRDEETFNQLREMNVRTLVLTGTADEVLDPRNSVILSQTIPHAELVEIKSGGHAMMYQYPKLLAHQIDVFIGN